MKTSDQVNFIKELSNNVTSELLSDVQAGKTPDTWDGVELRKLLADRFARVVFLGTLTGKRKREYNNTVLVNDL